jgi:hypothetical protein
VLLGAETGRDPDVDQDAEAADGIARRPTQRDRSGQRPAGREHVVDQQQATLPRLHLEHAGAVLEVVRDVHHGGWQLALLADRHEALAASLGERRRKDETS